MDETWAEPDVTNDDLQSYLQALSLHETPRVPLLGLTRDADGAIRMILAGRALFGLFGAASPADLSARLLGGSDTGSKRLVGLFETVPLEGAPRLERLRFALGQGSEIVTILCRGMTRGGRTLFIAAALGLRPDLLAAQPLKAMLSPTPAKEAIEAPRAAAALPVSVAAAAVLPAQHEIAQNAPARDAAALQADLRQRWPTARTLRFLWHTDADAVCTLITPPLADVVGHETADLVGRNLLDLAPQIDPTGRLAARLAGRETWSGLDLQWPLAGAAATVMVIAGAIPAFDADRIFDGFRGFGVIHLDRIKDAQPTRFAPSAEPARAINVVPFPGPASAGQPAQATLLSSDDQVVFAEIGAALRQQVPRDEPVVHSEPEALQAPIADLPAVPEPPSAPAALLEVATPATPPIEPGTPELATADVEAPTPVEPPHSPAARTREQEIGRNGLAVLDKLALGLLVSRNSVPIFANRHLLDMLGFADEDALHQAGGMTHLFGGLPGNVTGSEAVGVRGRDGAILPANARMQAIDWDGLPATLLTLRPSPPAPTLEPAVPIEPEPPREEVRRQPDEARRPQDDELLELRAILDTATDGVAVLDGDCTVLSLNRSGEALFGCDRSVVIGKPFLTLFAPHNQSLASDYWEGVKANGTKSLLNDGREFMIRAHQGGTIPVFMTLGRLGPGGGAAGSADSAEPARFCALFRDLTHWKKVEQDLDHARLDAEKASALKSDFLAKVSHEIRTPLNAIIGFAEVIMDERFGPVGNDRYKDYLRDIHRSGTHVMSLVNDLLDLSKIEAGKMDLNAIALDANKVITECVSLMQPQASLERVIMRLSLAANLPRIKADERSLRQIVINLLSNAVKFNEPGGQVIVATTRTESGQVVIRIRDTGPGMSDKDIEAALEPFRQLSTSRPMTAGTGLGLPLTKALVEANQAAFTIRSKIDQGTLVEVAFPPALVLAG